MPGVSLIAWAWLDMRTKAGGVLRRKRSRRKTQHVATGLQIPMKASISHPMLWSLELALETVLRKHPMYDQRHCQLLWDLLPLPQHQQ